MPTGYTADISKGITFEQYALNCARAFGALVMMRDDPADARIPDKFEPGTWHAERLAAERETLAKLEGMDDEAATRAANAAWDEAETRRAVRLQEIGEQRSKYAAMLAKVNAWTPPTPDHEGLRAFMCSQILESIDFDCHTGFYDTPTPRLTGQQWLEERKASTLRAIEFHARENAAEIDRANSRTRWVKALRESLEHHKG